METLKSPQCHDWNNFWGRKKVSDFDVISWSKRRILKIIAPYLRANATALDAGCGSGFFSKCFCDSGMVTYALDYSSEALEMAKQLTGGRASTLQEDLLSADLPNRVQERFDVIFSDGLFEHFEMRDQDRIMKNFVSLLSDKGVVITFVPNRWSPWELIRPFYMPGIHEQPFVLKKLKELNERTNLEVLVSGGINTLPFAWSPDAVFGPLFGMLLFTISKKNGSSK